jgi:hypothetical protein
MNEANVPTAQEHSPFVRRVSGLQSILTRPKSVLVHSEMVVYLFVRSNPMRRRQRYLLS